MASLYQHKSVNHLGHLLLSVLTGGLWVLPWILIWMNASRHNDMVDQRIHDLMRK